MPQPSPAARPRDVLVVLTAALHCAHAVPQQSDRVGKLSMRCHTRSAEAVAASLGMSTGSARPEAVVPPGGLVALLIHAHWRQVFTVLAELFAQRTFQWPLQSLPRRR
jgi:hypothetical protein